MLVSPAYAQSETPTTTTAETAVPGTDPAVAGAPDTGAILMQNVAMIVLLVVMFYFLLIRPQQKRFKEHKEMIDALKKGDKVITGGGLVGRIDTLSSDTEVLVDLGNGVKVTVLRSMIQATPDKVETTTVKK